MVILRYPWPQGAAPIRNPLMAASRRTSPYYTTTAHPAPLRAALAGTESCDVCVVGGGIAGCSAALHLAERGYRVVLLEEHRIGSGASGRSGGQVLAGTAAGPAAMRRLVGDDAARAVWEMTVEGLELVRTLIARHAIDCDWTSGQMQVAITQRQDAELRSMHDDLSGRLRYDSVRYMARDEVQTVLATRRYLSALYDSRGGHLHPLNYTLGLAAAAESRGVRIFEGTRALDFSGDAEGRAGNAERRGGEAGRRAGGTTALRVRTAGGTILCHAIALCGNTGLGATAPALARKIMAVGTCMVATERLDATRARSLIANRAAVSDMSWVLDYFRLSADDRLLFGGRVTYSGFDPARIAAGTRRRLIGVFPQLSDVKIEHAWGGYLDITANRAPHFGRLAPSVYFLQGFSGHGIALAGLAGKLLAEAVAGEAERFDVFARIPHADFPGGRLLRRPTLVTAMLYYRLRDLLG
jgi:gamma-glutamylputrescine oxidase